MHATGTDASGIKLKTVVSARRLVVDFAYERDIALAKTSIDPDDLTSDDMDNMTDVVRRFYLEWLSKIDLDQIPGVLETYWAGERLSRRRGGPPEPAAQPA